MLANVSLGCSIADDVSAFDEGIVAVLFLGDVVTKAKPCKELLHLQMVAMLMSLFGGLVGMLSLLDGWSAAILRVKPKSIQQELFSPW